MHFTKPMSFRERERTFKYTGTILRHERCPAMPIEILWLDLEGFDESNQGIWGPMAFPFPRGRELCGWKDVMFPKVAMNANRFLDEL